MTSREPILPNLQIHDYQPAAEDMAREVLDGLRRERPTLSPKYLYDAEGSRLFEAITRQPEYYPTRTEEALLREHAPRLPDYIDPDCLIAEPGAGNCTKARWLLDAWQPRGYMPMDISRDHLLEAGRALARDYPRLPVHAVCADYTRALDWPATAPPPRLVFFPGSTVGNFEPMQRRHFLGLLHELAGPGGALLIGADLHKDSATLDAAYNDRAGYTAAFNRNLLSHLNQVLGAGFEPDAFEHRAFYNENERRIEMHLDCQRDQQLTIGGEALILRAGQSIHTENSYKFTVDGFRDLLTETGFRPLACWRDPASLFSLHLAHAN